MAFEVQLEPKGAYIYFSGEVTYDQLKASRAQLWGNPDWDNLLFEILDFRDAASLEISTLKASMIASMDDVATVRSRRNKVAVIANSSNVMNFAVAYADAKKHSPWEVKIFNDLDSGRRWVCN